MKKVLVISSLNKWNDIRIYIKEICSLSKKYDVTYICAGENDEVRLVNNVKIEVLKKPNTVFRRIKHLIRISRYIKCQEAEVYHLQNPELLLLVPYIKVKFPQSKIIFDMHEDFEEAIKDKSWIPQLVRKGISQFYRLYLNVLLKTSLDCAIVTTPLIRKRFISFNNIYTIENFAPLVSKLPSSTLTPSNIQKCIDENNDKIKVVFTGLINEHRGVLKVIEAIKGLENTVLFMIGLYSERFLLELRKRISQDSLEDKIFIFDSIDYNMMLASMKQMDIGILPYLPYGNHIVTRPNKLFEYMMTSLPIICSNFPLYEEVIKQGVGISMNPLESDEIKAAIKKISGDSELRKIMGRKGHNLYIDKYNWSIEELKLFKLYEELLGG